jgi:hypothetical protein
MTNHKATKARSREASNRTKGYKQLSDIEMKTIRFREEEEERPALFMELARKAYKVILKHSQDYFWHEDGESLISRFNDKKALTMVGADVNKILYFPGGNTMLDLNTHEDLDVVLEHLTLLVEQNQR